MHASPIAAATSTAISALAERSALARAVEIATNAVEKRNTYPILANLRLQGDGQTLFVTGTDLDVEIVVALQASADDAFDVTIPAHLLKDILKKAPKADYVAFTQDGEDGVTADFERSNYKLTARPSKEFPTISSPGATAKRFDLTGKQLFNMLDAVAFAISKEETRYYLNGIFFHAVLDGNRHQLRAVTTDGHRMARQDMELPSGAEEMPGVIIPAKSVALLLKLMKGKACPALVHVEVTAARIRFQFDDVTFTTKTIEGTFPDYNRVIPSNNDKGARLNMSTFGEAIKAAGAIAGPRGKAVKVTFHNDTCTLSCTNPDQGSSEISFPVERDFDGDFEIGFNMAYLEDFLVELKPFGDDVTMKFDEAGSPTLITSDREGWTGVLMPMRV